MAFDGVEAAWLGHATSAPDAPTVIPIHFGTFPILAGTPEERAAELESADITMVPPSVGEPIV